MREYKIFRAVNGIDELTDPLFLNEGVVQDYKNFVLDEPGYSGTPMRRGSWENFGQSMGGNSIDNILSLALGKDESYLVALSNGDLYLSENGLSNWVKIYEGQLQGGPSGSLWVNNDHCLVYAGGKSIVLGGAHFANREQLSIESPEIKGTVPLQIVHYETGGSISAGWYNFVIVYETDSGDFSNPSLPFTAYKSYSTGSTGFTGTANKVVINNLPIPTDTRVTKKRIFRTRSIQTSDLSASPFIYYEIAVLPPSATEYTDTKHDDDISSVRYAKFTGMPEGKCFAIHKGRLFSGEVQVTVRNYFSPPFSNDGANDKMFRGRPEIMGGEIWNASKYRYRLVFVDENGTDSNYIETEEIVTPGEEYENMAKITLEYIPFLSRLVGTKQITAKRLYRTKKDGTIFYQHPVSIGFNVIAYEDVTNDDSLIIDAIHSTSVIKKSYPSSIIFSEPGMPFTFFPENIITVFSGQGDEIMSIFDDGEGLLILKRKGVYKLYTTGDPITWRVVTISEDIGQELANGVLKNKRGCYIFCKGNFYLYSGGNFITVGTAIKNTLSTVNKFFQPAYFAKREWCCFPVEDVNNQKMLLVYDEKNGSWYKFTHPGLSGLHSFVANSEELISFSGFNIVRYVESPTGSDIIGEVDSEIESSILTKKYSLSGFELMRLRKLWLYLISLVGEVEVKVITECGEITKVYSFSNEEEEIRVCATSQMTGGIDFCRSAAIILRGTGIKALKGIKLELRNVR